MGKRKHAFIDEELDSAVEKFKAMGDFTSKVDASEKAGQVLNAALDEFGDSVRDELERELDETEKQEDFGIEHDMLGL